MQSLGNCISRDELDTSGDKNVAYEDLPNMYCNEINNMPLSRCDKISMQKAITQVFEAY